MSRKITRLLFISIMLIVLGITPAAASPGSEDDPLVSRKYVDDRIAELDERISQIQQSVNGPQTAAGPQSADGSQSVNGQSGSGVPGGSLYDIPPEIRGELLAEALAGVESVYGDLIRQAAANVPQGGLPAQAAPTDAQMFQVVFAPAGTVIYGDSSAEFILRGGSATVVSGLDGLCDVTSGADIVNGQSVPYNHLLIVPVGDGRGVRVSADAYFMIKGGYYFD